MPNSDLVQSVARALDILEAAARAEEGITLQALADTLGVRPSTAHNLARTLVARGFLEKTTRPTRYHLGATYLELANAHGNRDLLRRATTAIEQLSAELGNATVLLAEAVGGEVVISLRIGAERPGVLQRPRSWALHPYGSATPLVFQAFWGAEERAAYRRRHPFWEEGVALWETIENLDRFLEEVRSVGYAAPPIRGDSILKVAAPVFGPHQEMVAALGASITAADLTPAQRQKCIQRVADRARALAPTR